MTVDRALAIAGLVEGFIGLALTVLVAMNARQLQGLGDRYRYAGGHGAGPRTSESFADDEDDIPTRGSNTARTRSRTSTAVSRPSSSSGTGDPDPEILGGIGLVLIVALAVAAIWLVQHQRVILQVAAFAALAMSLVVVAALTRAWRSTRVVTVRWPLLLIVADMLVSVAPALVTHPLFGEGRFDNLGRWLPRQGAVMDRVHADLKTYDDLLIYHVTLQNLGLAIVVVMALVSAVLAVRRQTAGRRDATVALTVGLFAGALLLSGVLTSVAVRIFSTTDWTVRAAADAGVHSDNPPPLGLVRARTGALTLLIARCGNERVLSLTANGTKRDIPSEPPPGAPLTFPLPMAAQVKVVILSTRYYRTTVTFAALPKPGQFLAARQTDTYQEFRQAGYACR